MMIALGHFLFLYRNGIFPLIYALLLFNSRPILPNDWTAAVLGLAIAASGQLLRAVTVGLEYIIRGGRKRHVYADRLVQGGVFAHCRNPLYLGNYLILVGVGLASNSLLFAACALPLFALAYAAIIAAEEEYLRGKFGAEFDSYCSRVNRIIPDFSGFGQTLAGMRFNWRRLITAEYGSAYIWMAAVILVALKNAWQHGHPGGSAFVVLLGIAFVLLSLAYLMARVLKKTGRLKSPASVNA
jgi:protein-S-isoprenylcysteine O-methyltransferase Ste14